MAISGVTSKCYILTLFERDDGARLLLGSGAYEFKDGQQHFEANDMVNDTVDVQGTDGILLAGQVRRASTQSFDGYIGDGTTTKAKVEEYRRDFIEFFAKNHFYKAVYVFSDGSAIMRQRGFIVDAPEVKELYQIHPEYHVALNFEDVNYYEYDEDAEGEEIYSQTLRIARVDAEQGGLVWDEYGAVMLPMGTSTATVSGSNFTIDNALPFPPEDVQLLGGTEQARYSGKNLFDASSMEEGYYSNTGVWYASTTSGTSDYIAATSGSRITASLSSSAYAITISEFDSNKTWLRRSLTNSVSSKTLTLGSNTAYVRVSFNYDNSTTVTSTLLEEAEAQVELGAVATSYEPYVGGIPSPNPDYPQPIETVTGRQEVGIRTGSELNPFATNNAGATRTAYGVSFRLNSDGTITLNGTSTNSGECYWNFITNAGITGGSTLKCVARIVSGDVSSGGVVRVRSMQNTAGYYTRDITLAADGSIVSSDAFSDNAPSYNVFRIQVTSGTAIDNLTLAIGVVPINSDGSEALQRRLVEVNLGKNLFNQGDVQWVRNDNDRYTSTADTNTTRIRTQDLIKLVGGETYTISGLPSSIELGMVKFYEKPSSTTVYSRVVTQSFTVPANATYVIFQFNGTDFTSETNVLMANADIQLERGSTATSYSPYFEPIELCKIGDYQDRIYENGGKWYLEKMITKIVLDGSENWAAYYGGAFRLALSQVVGWDDDSQIGPVISDGFTAVAYQETIAAGGPYYGIALRQTVARGISIRNKDYTVTADFKTWLTSNNVTVYAPLATPTTTEITNEQVLAGLNQLSGGSLYAGENNVLVASEDEPATLQMTYKISGGEDPGGFEWEEGGGGGVVTVMVDSIDNVYPLITITGPATNPAIENLTTGTTMSYNGTVAAGQELVIDTMAQTAELNGTNVLSNLYGDFIYLAPGANRIAFTTTNVDAPAALSQFNEVVG